MPRWVYKRLFILALPCMNRKSRLFRKTKTVPCAENLSKCIRKPLISARQTPSFFHKSFFSVLERHPILQTKSISFAQSFLNYHPKQPFSTLHLPFPPSHNLLSTKEQRCSFNLRPNFLRCNAGASHRFKAFSPPFCAKNRFRLVLPESFPKLFPAEL